MITVGELITILEGYPRELPVGTYSWNAAYRPHDDAASEIESVELCKNKTILALVCGFR